MTVCKPVIVSINLRVANSLLSYNGNTDKTTVKWYQSAIGFLIWPDVYTCLDIAYSTGVLGC